ncbi:NAD-dependent protein deacylase [Paenibacillus pinistramenti]|uniref:NAD-dependent protein deacylase n=1 Tax=Paenibacillus pinistramenti TaxID=1768003 RepID=UPI001109388A|nr:NAD-dependent protein deacylase [Paenibacillus pinistramenti]
MNNTADYPVNKLAEWISESERIVFFGGAGISTESGIPDFRSAAGLYQTETNSPYSPEEILSRSFFDKHPEVFFDFYRTKMLHPSAQPNAAHRLLAKLEDAGKLDAIVTQNIDGLHQSAGSRNVLELHGSVHRNYCMKCRTFHSLQEVIDAPGPVPLCRNCGGIVKPDVVLYGENLHDETIAGSIQAIRGADLLIIGGTSLTVYPAAQFVDYFRGNRTVLINIAQTGYDSRAGLLITEPIGQVCETVSRRLSLG